MAFSSTIGPTVNVSGMRILTGTWDGAGVTNGTIDFRGTAAGGAASVPFNVIHADAENCTTAAAMVVKVTDSGTIAIGSFTSNDTGRWIAICK